MRGRGVGERREEREGGCRLRGWRGEEREGG